MKIKKSIIITSEQDKSLKELSKKTLKSEAVIIRELLQKLVDGII